MQCQALGHSEGTGYLGTRGALKEHSGTRVLKAPGTRSLTALEHLGIWILGALNGHLDTQWAQLST